MTASNMTAPLSERPLLSPGFVYRVTAAAALLAIATIAISIGGRWMGERIALAGHTESTELHDIFIGRDHLRLPANVLRFENQRITGSLERADLYLLWPEMEGYSNEKRLRFNDVTRPESLIFLRISQSTMSRDMSGRIGPIYSHLLTGKPSAGPAGLKRYETKANSGYSGEAFFVGRDDKRNAYAVRCMLPREPELTTGADCQRDIHIGQDLTILYRFSSRLLADWRELDAAVRQYAEGKLVK